MPQYVIEQFSELAQGEFIMTTGVGQHQMWAAQWTRFKHPRTWITSGGLGSMGYGLPAAMGAQAAFPDALVVDIDGDGSFLMNIQELATRLLREAAGQGDRAQQPAPGHGRAVGGPVPRRATAPTPTSGPIDHPEATGQGEGELPEVDLPRLRRDRAAASASPARQVRKKAEVVDALKEMIAHPGPYVLDVLVPYQEHVLPMIPSGGTVREIIKS